MIGVVHTIHEKFIKQLTGSRDGTRNCTMAAGAMGLFRHTLGRVAVSAQRLRDLTGDHTGGTTLDQLKSALVKLGHGSGWSGPYRGIATSTFYSRLRGGMGAVVQGSSRATYGTKWKASFTFRGNHAWYIARGRTWDSSGRPAELLVYDPLADGRAAGIARSPFWIPRSYVEKFFAYLDFGYETLGFGKVYALFTRGTVPHRHATAGGVYYRAQRKLKGGYNIRSRPGGTKLRATKAGEVLDVWQKKSDGPLMGGSRVWYGDHSGTRWVHASALA